MKLFHIYVTASFVLLAAYNSMSAAIGLVASLASLLVSQYLTRERDKDQRTDTRLNKLEDTISRFRLKFNI